MSFCNMEETFVSSWKMRKRKMGYFISTPMATFSRVKQNCLPLEFSRHFNECCYPFSFTPQVSAFSRASRVRESRVMKVKVFWSSFFIAHYFSNVGTPCKTVEVHVRLYKATWLSQKWSLTLSQAFWWLGIRCVSFCSCLHTMGM